MTTSYTVKFDNYGLQLWKLHNSLILLVSMHAMLEWSPNG